MKIKRLINQELFIILSCALSIVVAYWHDMTILWDDALKNEMSSYILALPFLIAYMIHRRRKLLKAQFSLEIEKHENIIFKDIIGASLCLSALFLYVYGSFTFNVLEYHLASLIIFVFGCAVFLLGIQNLKNTVFPLGCLLLLIIPYREEAYQASAQLSILTSTITFNLLKFLGYPVSLSSVYESPSIMVKTPSGEHVPFIIDIPCAGAYSLIAFSVFALFFAYLSRGSHLKKALWLLIGFSIIYTVNIVRVSLTLAIGYWFGIETAMGIFHLLSGSVLIFLATFLMILIGEKFLKVKVFREQQVAEEDCPLCEENKARNESFCNFCSRFFNPSSITVSRADLGKILALSLLLATLINLQVPTLALSQQNLMELDIHELGGSKETQSFLPLIEGYEPKFVYRDQRFERVAQQDASLLYVYYHQNISYAPIFASVEIADSYSKLHRWEICLYIVPAEQGRQVINPIVTKDVQILENPPLIGRLFIFQYVESSQTVMILYWYEKLAFKMGGGWGSRYVKTSLIAYLDIFVRTGEIKSVNDHATLEKKMVSMAQDIINHWEPVKTWSAFIVVFAGWGQNLAIITILASSSVVTILHLKRLREEGKMAQSTYKQLTWHSTFSKEEKEILKVLEILSKEGETTGIELAKSFERETGKKIKPRRLIEIIRHLEEFNLVKKKMIKKNEEPYFIYGTNIVM